MQRYKTLKSWFSALQARLDRQRETWGRTWDQRLQSRPRTWGKSFVTVSWELSDWAGVLLFSLPMSVFVQWWQNQKSDWSCNVVLFEKRQSQVSETSRSWPATSATAVGPSTFTTGESNCKNLCQYYWSTSWGFFTRGLRLTRSNFLIMVLILPPLKGCSLSLLCLSAWMAWISLLHSAKAYLVPPGKVTAFGLSETQSKVLKIQDAEGKPACIDKWSETTLTLKQFFMHLWGEFINVVQSYSSGIRIQTYLFAKRVGKCLMSSVMIKFLHLMSASDHFFLQFHHKLSLLRCFIPLKVGLWEKVAYIRIQLSWSIY